MHIGNGIPPGLKTVGLASGAVRESQERVKPAVINSGYQFPNRKVTINLAPADMRKDGSGFDLPIALSLLGATGRLSNLERLRRYLVIGELALDGRVRGIKGALSTALHARAAKYDGLVLPRENAMEAAVVGHGVAILPVDTLRETLEFFEGLRELTPMVADVATMFQAHSRYEVDFSDVKGQEQPSALKRRPAGTTTC